MAIGNLVSVTINPTAWQAEFIFSGMNSGYNYSPGFNLHNFTSPNTNIVFSLLSSGFDDNTNPTTLSRTIYGTTGIRQPWPNNIYKYETVDGNGNTKIRVALSDFIYQNDSNITVNLLSGFYYSGNIISSGATNFPVTNNSSLPYPRVLGNWTWPGWDRITSNTYPFRCVAFHRSAQQGRPVRAVKFIANDEHGNYVSGIVNNCIIDSSVPDAVPVTEYVCNLSMATLTTGDAVTGNFIAYPWYGDTGSLLNTNDGVNVQPTPLYAPIQLLNDKSSNYGVTIVVIDPITGNNNAGQAVDISQFNANNPPPAYQTIHSGAKAILAFNNNQRGRNDIGAGIIYLKSGTHAWVGGSTTYGNTPKTNVIISSFPTNPAFSAVITGNVGDQNLSNRIKLDSIFIQNLSTICFNGMTHLWFNKCYMDYTGIATVYGATLIAFTNNNLNHVNDGFPYSTQTASPYLIRGNLWNINQLSTLYTAVGNMANKSNTNQLWRDGYVGITTPTGGNQIFAYNTFYKFSCNSNPFLELYSPQNLNLANTFGACIIQNIIENTGNASSNMIGIAPDNNIANPVNNILEWHNTFVGQRNNQGYNNSNPTGFLRLNWSIQNNLIDNYNCKSDTFSDPTFGMNGQRTGNWPIMFGVGSAGNILAAISGIGGQGFAQDFAGLNSIMSGYDGFLSTGTSIVPVNQDTGFMGYIGRKSFNGVTADIGSGNYNLLSTSPAVSLPLNWLLPYDIAGNPRTLGDAAGAFTFLINNPTSGPFLTNKANAIGIYKKILFLVNQKNGLYNPQ